MDARISIFRFGGITAVLAIILLAVILGLQSCTSSTGPEEVEPDLSLKIGMMGRAAPDWVFQGGYFDMPIYIEADSVVQIDSFNLKISYNAKALTFIEGNSGDIFEGWPELAYTSQVQTQDTNLAGVIKITGINGVDSFPMELGSNADSILLLSLKFWVTDDRHYECLFIPVNFYWENCNDNIIYFHSGHRIAVSNNVYRFNWIDPQNPFVKILPEDDTVDEDDHIFGIFDSCRENMANAFDKIDFYHGGAAILCAEPIDWTIGDINLNGLANELADFYLLLDFFIHGESVFTVDRAKQLRACDINRDRFYPTLADLEYMNRIIAGDAVLPGYLDHFADTVSVTFDSDVISLDSEIDLGAAHFIFEGEVGFIALNNDMTVKSAYRDGNTHILFYSTQMDKFEAGSNPVLQLSSDAKLKSCESCGYYGNMVVTKIIE
jgi:hypothetical protein